MGPYHGGGSRALGLRCPTENVAPVPLTPVVSSTSRSPPGLMHARVACIFIKGLSSRLWGNVVTQTGAVHTCGIRVPVTEHRQGCGRK